MAGLDLSISGSRNESLLSPGGGGDRSDMDTSPYKSSDSTCSTPRKNKRKSSEPKRRSDFSIKRFCPDTPHALGPELDSEEGGGRPGYGEHPPSTPETSASSSTPSPPDVAQLRIPNVVTSRHRNSARPASPTSHRVTSTSPEMTSSTHAPPPHLAAQPAFMTAAAAPYGLNMAYMPVNPVLLQHMMALQQQQLAGAPVVVPPPPQHLATAAATATTPLPVPSSSQLPAAPKRQAHPSQQPAVVNQNNTHLSSRPSSRTGSSHHQAPAISATSGGSAKTPSRSSHDSRSSRESRESRSQSVNTSRDLSQHSRTSATSANESLNVSTTSQFSDSLCPSDNEGDLDGSRRSRKNYKNMTRERRIEANARERSRVHTISAAFETLRRTVPSFSHTQRLSKLAILRIACSYISALATMAGHDLSPPGHSQDSFEESVDQCTKTIQNEGRAKRRH